MKSEDILTVENLNCNNTTFIIRWDMTKLCNYYCDFCIQGNKKNHLKESNGENATIRNTICNKLLNFIENDLSKKYKNLHLYLIGGEVTILEDFITILSKLANCHFSGKMRIYLLTNLSMNKDQLKQIKEIFTNNKVELFLSATFYKEYTTEKEFIKKIKFLKSNNKLKDYFFLKKSKSKNKNGLSQKIYNHIKKYNKKLVNLHINIKYPIIKDEDYQSYIKFKKKYDKYFISSETIKYIIIRDYKQSISDELLNKLPNKKSNKIKVTTVDKKVKYFYNTSTLALAIENRKFKSKGYTCDSGVNNLSIDNLGNIYRCPSCPHDTKIGNVLKDDIKLICDEIICPTNSCYCDYFHLIKKQV